MKLNFGDHELCIFSTKWNGIIIYDCKEQKIFQFIRSLIHLPIPIHIGVYEDNKKLIFTEDKKWYLPPYSNKTKTNYINASIESKWGIDYLIINGKKQHGYDGLIGLVSCQKMIGIYNKKNGDNTLILKWV